MEDVTREAIRDILVHKQNRLRGQNGYKPETEWLKEDKDMYDFIEKLYEVFN